MCRLCNNFFLLAEGKPNKVPAVVCILRRIESNIWYGDYPSFMCEPMAELAAISVWLH